MCFRLQQFEYVEMDLDLTPIPERSIQDARPPFVTPTTSRFTRLLRSSQENESFGMNETKEQWFTPTSNDFTPMVLRSQCKASHEKMAEFQEKNEELQEEVRDLIEKCDEGEKRFAQLTKEFEALEKKNCATQDENSFLKAMISSMRAESSIAEETLKKKNDDFDNLTKEFLSLQEELNNFKKVVSPATNDGTISVVEKKMTQLNLNRKKSFIARPVPNFDKVARLPPVNKKKTTETKPFDVYNRPTRASINKQNTTK